MEGIRITVDELKAMLDRDEAVTLLDVRNPTDYGASEVRLPGAVRIPVGELEGRAGELDHAKTVVAYCT